MNRVQRNELRYRDGADGHKQVLYSLPGLGISTRTWPNFTHCWCSNQIPGNIEYLTKASFTTFMLQNCTNRLVKLDQTKQAHCTLSFLNGWAFLAAHSLSAPSQLPLYTTEWCCTDSGCRMALPSMPLLQGAQRKVKLQKLVLVHMGSQSFDFIFSFFPLTFRSHQILHSRQKYLKNLTSALPGFWLSFGTTACVCLCWGYSPVLHRTKGIKNQNPSVRQPNLPGSSG